MPYVMHRVFCASPGDLEPERQAFYEVLAEINEQEAMPLGILFVAVSLPAATIDKRPYQAAIGENVRACRYYVQVLEDTWGPPERDFEREYLLATQCVADPALPMQNIAVLFKKPLVPHQVDPRVAEFKQVLKAGNGPPSHDFEDVGEFKSKLRAQMSTWLATAAG